MKSTPVYKPYPMWMKAMSLWLSIAMALPVVPVFAQDGDGGNPGGRTRSQQDATLNLKFRNMPIQLLMTDYSQKTGRTILEAPGLPKSNVSLESQNGLTLQEYLQAIETVLGMNGIALVPVGEKFLKVVPIGAPRQEGELPIRTDPDASKLQVSGEIISQLISLKNITIAEAQPAIDALKHTTAQIHLFENTSSLMITDTSANVRRIMEVIALIDQPSDTREEPIIIPILHAKASEIQQKLTEIIADSQADATKTAPRTKDSGAPGVEAPPTIPGVIRATPDGAGTPATPAATQTPEQIAEKVARGAIIGRVRMISDDRTNILILVMRKENRPFFEKIIKVLDIETAPDVTVNIVRLEYADAETVAATLNTLIGGTVVQPSAAAKPPAEGEAAPAAGGATTLSDYAKQVEAKAATPTSDQKSKVGQLNAENIKVLADKRTNSILLMASKSDIAALKEMIKSMDIMLSQVAIDVVIFSVGLNDNRTSGIEWIQKSLVAYEKQNGSKDAIMSFAGVAGGDSTLRDGMIDASTATSVGSLSGASGNLTYFLSFFDLNLDAIVSFVASDGKTEVLSSPKIVTTDNKPATIDVTAEQYFFKGLKPVTASNGSVDYTDDVELKKVGTKLTVTPHINEKKMVVMEIEQALEEVGDKQHIGDNDWPTINSSTMSAEVAVRSNETIVLGGMIKSSRSKSESKVPFLGDIPFIGNLFKSKSNVGLRQEIVVFITPHVLDTPEEIAACSRQSAAAIDAKGLWPNGWVPSSMAQHLGQTAAKREDRSYMRADRRTHKDDHVPSKTNSLDSTTAVPVEKPAVDPDLQSFIQSQDERQTP